MSEAPERIMAYGEINTRWGVQFKCHPMPMQGMPSFPHTEYVRADCIEELEAKLAKAVGALGDIYDGEPEWPDDIKRELNWCRTRAKDTLAELKGEQMTNSNTGNWNTGDSNTGDRNAGDLNSGYRNSGNCNTGERNTGCRNTGDSNTGDRNAGDSNAGHRNTGDSNTGDWNTGNWNTGNFHVGCFNTIDAEKAYYFNKLLDVSEWNAAEKPDWLYTVTPTKRVTSYEMTDKEKEDNPSHETTGGYLRVNDMKVAYRNAYEAATPEDRALTKWLPGFDADVFMQITGIDLRDKPKTTCAGREIEIDGVTYVLKLKGQDDE
jgi:hypothetical protein